LKSFKTVLFIALLAGLVGASGWAQSAHGVVVPISGEYYDAAGGLLVYSGTVTLDWPTVQTKGEPVSGSLVASAWSKSTGASYTFYGYYTDFFTEARGSDMMKSVVAVGSGARPEFMSTINVKLAQFSADVQTIAFAGR
jgi:hypothetical protein